MKATCVINFSTAQLPAFENLIIGLPCTEQKSALDFIHPRNLVAKTCFGLVGPNKVELREKCSSGMRAFLFAILIIFNMLFLLGNISFPVRSR